MGSAGGIIQSGLVTHYLMDVMLAMLTAAYIIGCLEVLDSMALLR